MDFFLNREIKIIRGSSNWKTESQKGNNNTIDSIDRRRWYSNQDGIDLPRVKDKRTQHTITVPSIVRIRARSLASDAGQGLFAMLLPLLLAASCSPDVSAYCAESSVDSLHDCNSDVYHATHGYQKG